MRNPHSDFCNTRLRACQIRQLYSGARPGLYGGLIGSGVMTVILWPVVAHWRLLVWLGVFLALQLPRQALASAFSRANPAAEAAIPWLRSFLLGSVATAAMWGFSGIFLFPVGSFFHQVFVGILLAGVATSAAVAQAPIAQCYLSSILLTLVPIMGRFVYEGEEIAVAVVAVGMVFVLALVATARSVDATIAESIKMSLEKEDSLENLKQAHQELETRVAERTAELSTKNRELAQVIAERKAVEEALRQSEERCRIVVETMSEGVALEDENGIHSFVNEKLAEMLGYSKEDLIGRPFWEFVDARYHEQQELETVKRRQAQSSVYETLLRRRDGKSVPVLVSASPFIDKNGSFRGTVAVFKDITARKRTQEALNQSEELYRRLIEESFDGIFVQKGTRIIFANSRLHEMLGYEHGDLVGRDHWTVYHPGYQHLTRKRAQARMRGEDVPSQYEVRLQKTDGSSFEGEINAKALLVEGEPGIQVWIRDISQRKRAQEALKESEQRYRQLTQSSLTGIYIHQDGEFVYVNERLGEIMGYRAEELLGRKYWEFVHPEDVEWVRAIGRDRGLGKSAPSQYEFRVVCKNGETKWLDAFITSISHLGRVATMGNVADSTDRKRVEAALKESENTYRTIFETTGTATVIINADTTISLANTEYQKLTGYSKEEIDGKLKWTETVLPEDLLWMKKQHELRRSDPAAAPKHYEFRLKDKEGKIKNVFLNVAMIPGTRQSVASLLDITDLKRAEQALLEREEQYRSVYETALVGLFRTRISDGKVLKANHKASQILGYATADELIPDEVVVSEFYPPERRAEFLRELQEYGEVSDFEVHLTLPSGRDVDIAVSAKIYPERGYVEGAFVDTTGRKEAEEELRRSEQKYRQILETIADGYHEVDLQGNMTLVNDSLCDMIGYSREEFLHINYRALMDEENARQAFQLYNQVYRSGNPDRGLCLEVIRKDGAKRIVSGSISLVKDADGKPAGFRGILRDITQQKHLEEQLRHAARMEAVGHLAGGIAHDFNNLLTAMMGYTNILIQQLPEGAAYQEKLAQIHRASERAVRLTQQLLAFSRKQVLDMRVIDLNAVITDLEKMLRRLIGENIEIVTHLNTAICNVHADLGQVEQILMNLAVNARDAMPHGGILRIETANVVLDEEYAQSHPEVTPGDYVMMAVSDTGRGMDSQVLARIFDPFFTTKEKGVGTGLGLSTVYGIVKQHKGHISAYSEPDLGSTFKVYLPCAHEAIDHPMKKSSTQSIPRGNESVLVVEDEEIVRNLTCEALEMLGYSTLAASDPEEAIALCDMHEGPIELLLTDVVLPRMDGKTLFERLVRTRPHLKVLYVSGYTENFIVHHGVLERTVQFLQKPFTIEGLARKVREVLDEISEGSEEEPSS